MFVFLSCLENCIARVAEQKRERVRSSERPKKCKQAPTRRSKKVKDVLNKFHRCVQRGLKKFKEVFNKFPKQVKEVSKKLFQQVFLNKFENDPVFSAKTDVLVSHA